MTNLELMTTSAERLADLGRPCLPHLDTLIVNDFEIGGTPNTTRRADGSTDFTAVKRAIGRTLEAGPLGWVVAHFPEGALAGGRERRLSRSARWRRPRARSPASMGRATPSRPA